MGAANRSGRTLEDVIASVLRSKGIPHEPQATLTQCSIYGRDTRVDFLVRPCGSIPRGLIIEARWQDVTGSAEEKLPYLVLNIKRSYPCPAIIVIDGHGFSGGALGWLRAEVDGEKLLAVMSIREFISWCNRKI